MQKYKYIPINGDDNYIIKVYKHEDFFREVDNDFFEYDGPVPNSDITEKKRTVAAARELFNSETDNLDLIKNYMVWDGIVEEKLAKSKKKNYTLTAGLAFLMSMTTFAIEQYLNVDYHVLSSILATATATMTTREINVFLKNMKINRKIDAYKQNKKIVEEYENMIKEEKQEDNNIKYPNNKI